VEVVAHATTGRPTGSVVDGYRYPAQEMEIRPGNKLKLLDGNSWGEVVAVDRGALTVDVKKGRKQADHHAVSAFAFTHVPTAVLEEAIARFASGVADRGRVGADGARENAAAHRLLLAATPTLKPGDFAAADGESAVAFAVRIANDLDATVLPIQGPPGSGKTYCGAEMICALVKAGKKVDVTATDHQVIRNLPGRRAARHGVSVQPQPPQRRDVPCQVPRHPGGQPAAVRAAVPEPSADEAGECALSIPGAGAVGGRSLPLEWVNGLLGRTGADDDGRVLALIAETKRNLGGSTRSA